MKTTSFRSGHLGAGMFWKMLFSGLVFALLIGVQSTEAQVFNQTQLPAQGAGQTDAQSGMSKTFVSTLMNADLAPQIDATGLLNDAMKDLDAQIDAGNLPQGTYAALYVRMLYWQYLYEELEKGAELYSLLLSSVSYLDGLVSQLNPALNVTTAGIYQETITLLSI